MASYNFFFLASVYHLTSIDSFNSVTSQSPWLLSSPFCLFMSLDTVYCLRHCFINPTEAILPSVKYNVKGQEGKRARAGVFVNAEVG